MRNAQPLRLFLCAAMLLLGTSVMLRAESAFSSEEVSSSAAIAELDTPPKPVKQNPPNIPPELHGLKASVQVGFIIDEKGRVTKARVVQSSNASFDDITLRCVRDWEFQPGTKGGKPVSVRVVIPLRFK
jgi:periplasmic protein TonB